MSPPIGLGVDPYLDHWSIAMRTAPEAEKSPNQTRPPMSASE